jgi:hypothetical protein
MTRTMRAWRKANRYVRSDQHAKAAYWLSHTLAILDGERARRRRLEGIEIDCLLGALLVLVVILIAKG